MLVNKQMFYLNKPIGKYIKKNTMVANKCIAVA